MKVESKKVFTPITITLETQEDVSKFFDMLHHHLKLDRESFYSINFYKGYTPCEDVKFAMRLREQLKQI